ncbi:MFS transporter [Tardiphaga sp.]|uniref:MFS transporter n=1 Tax=Tardiphaga sp. TaxID=1926292 RepID=UPI00352BCC81
MSRDKPAKAPPPTAQQAVSTQSPMQPGPPASVPLKIAVALFGIWLSAMMAGLNSRLSGLALADIRGTYGFGSDEASWINVCYSAGELLIMPFATCFAITFTVRRFYLGMLWATAVIAAIAPFVVSLPLLVALRTLQGVTAGALVPLLMMMALRFLPMSIRLHGLALYALTATFSPNVAIWLAGYWLDTLENVNWVSWQFVPTGVICTILVGWGLPKEPIHWQRFQGINWFGIATGVPGLFLLGVALGQGNRLDWFNSPTINVSLTAGGMFLLAYIKSEWNHPAPFIRFQLLGRRNIQVAFTCFVMILVVFSSGASVPMSFLASAQGYHALESAPLGLIIGAPQLLFGSLVALLLYRKWIDARATFAIGMLVVAAACFGGTRIDPTWTWHDFVTLQVLQAIGQPLTVVSMLFLSTSVVQPIEGPFIAGLVNTLRVLGTIIGAAVVGRIELVRDHFHSSVIIDRYGAIAGTLPHGAPAVSLARAIAVQVSALTTSDVYAVLGTIALAIALAAALFKYVPAPSLPLPPNVVST